MLKEHDHKFDFSNYNIYNVQHTRYFRGPDTNLLSVDESKAHNYVGEKILL